MECEFRFCGTMIQFSSNHQHDHHHGLLTGHRRQFFTIALCLLSDAVPPSMDSQKSLSNFHAF
jgi:hypothetical protein